MAGAGKSQINRVELVEHVGFSQVREYLLDRYYRKVWSCTAISEELRKWEPSLSPQTIWNWMAEFSFPRRPRGGNMNPRGLNGPRGRKGPDDETGPEGVHG